MVNIALRKDFVICIPNSLWISLHAPWMALNVIRVTSVQFQCYRFCRESLSAMCASYALFSAIITWFFLRQSGFRKNLRTETALIRIIDDLFNLDKDRVSGVVLIDYCKAFYMVDYELLLKKLEAHGMVNTELKWCRSYLTGRKQVVHLSGKESSGTPMEHGIPQGSILGPIFFILFINDLPLHVSSQEDLYDDGTLAASAHFNNLLEL